MPALVEVIIKTIDQGSKTATRELGGELAGLAAKYISVGAVAAGAYKVISDSIKTTQEYARSVRDLSLASGASAEEASRMLQVLDDFELTAQDVTAATRFMTKAGLAPTIETVALLSDQYLSLNSAQERNEFILKNLGRGGMQWANVLNQGSKAIRDLNDGVNDNLILTDKNVRQMELWRLKMDDVGDTVEGLKVQLGIGLVGVLDGSTVAIQKQAQEIFKAAQGYEYNTNMAGRYTEAQRAAWEEAKNLATEQIYASQGIDTAAESMEAAAVSAEELAAQVKAIDEANRQFLGVLSEVGSAQEEYNAGMVEARDALYAGTITTEEYSAKVAELAASYEDASARIVLSIVEMKLAQDGWTNAELNAYLEIGKQQGVFTESQIKMTRAAIESADELVSSYDELDGPMLHVAERAEDADVAFGGMARAAAELGEGLRKDAASGASALTSALNGIPTVINVDVNIRVHGSLPKGIMGGSGGTVLVQCFVAGTLVTLSDGTRKPIEQLQIGDEVRSYNIERREFVAGKVSKIMNRDVTEYLNIDGILVTEEHPFWHVGRGEWVKAKAVRRNDFLLRDYGGTKVVNFVFKVSEPATVYNLTVDGEHNYFAGGVLVHNKSVDDFDSGTTPHASGGMFTIPHAYGNEGFMLGNGDTASGGEKLAISPKGQDFIDYDRFAAAIPKPDYKAMARAFDQVLQQRGY
jgi:hypothetical protein